ncbi:MAG: hypothetical protein ACI4I3_02180 [Acutalibacteraceae bacterium]
MKRIITLIIILAITLSLVSCKMSSPAVISSNGKTYEMITGKDGGRALDSNGNLIVDAGKDENGKEVTEVLSEKYLIVDKEKLMAPAYDLKIPEYFNLKSSEADPLLENKQGTIQFSIMDKTESASDFESYVIDTYNSAKATGIANSEIENITVADIPMQRFKMKMTDDEGSELEAYGYFAKVNGRVLLITVTSKDGGIENVSQADDFVAGIDFLN